jgi:hypothetical protein
MEVVIGWRKNSRIRAPRCVGMTTSSCDSWHTLGVFLGLASPSWRSARIPWSVFDPDDKKVLTLPFKEISKFFDWQASPRGEVNREMFPFWNSDHWPRCDPSHSSIAMRKSRISHYARHPYRTRGLFMAQKFRNIWFLFPLKHKMERFPKSGRSNSWRRNFFIAPPQWAVSIGHLKRSKSISARMF